MIQKNSLLIATLFFLCFSYSANAAFTIKHTAAVVTVSAVHNTGVSPKEKRMAKYQAVKNLLHDEDWHPKQHHASAGGWEGIASFVLAMRGIFMFPPAFILAIVFGAMGMGKGAKHRGMAIAGFAIGLVGAFIWGFIIAMSMGA